MNIEAKALLSIIIQNWLHRLITLAYTYGGNLRLPARLWLSPHKRFFVCYSSFHTQHLFPAQLQHKTCPDNKWAAAI